MIALFIVLLAAYARSSSVCPTVKGSLLCRTNDNMTWDEVVELKLALQDMSLPPEYLLPSSLLPDENVTDVSTFPQTSGWFTERELKITESTAAEVLTKISRGQWTAQEVLEASIKRTVAAHQLFNPLTEILFERGRATARRLDKYYRKHKKTVGPLHGLPVSMKDTFRFKGYDTTIGFVSACLIPDEVDSLTVTALENLGAVLFVKTNVVTGLMGGESINNIFNATKNPYNLKLTPGGSSGGESALIAFKGSFTGISTDVAGSIRTPATNTGLYSIRPSIGRCSTLDMKDGMPGQPAVGLVCGPMARNVADLQLVLSSLVFKELWKRDPSVLPIPWRGEEEELPSKLSFAWANGDELVQPWPPIQRAMHIIREKLEALGHEVIEWIPPQWPEENNIVPLLQADSGLAIQRAFNESGEPFLPILAPYLKWITPENRTTVDQYWQMIHKRQLYSESYRKAWTETSNLTSTGRHFDALIMPSTSFPAKERGTPFPYTYTHFAALLDLTSAAFPVTRIDPLVDIVNTTFVPKSEKDKENQALYDDPYRWANAPVGLELIGQRLEEERILATLAIIESALAN